MGGHAAELCGGGMGLPGDARARAWRASDYPPTRQPPRTPSTTDTCPHLRTRTSHTLGFSCPRVVLHVPALNTPTPFTPLPLLPHPSISRTLSHRHIVVLQCTSQTPFGTLGQLRGHGSAGGDRGGAGGSGVGGGGGGGGDGKRTGGGGGGVGHEGPETGPTSQYSQRGDPGSTG
jgi:uncharacterized membrane protein YgcG